ncbi:3-ketoacyl-ACP reductase [candidate division KSB1 bacterium]
MNFKPLAFITGAGQGIGRGIAIKLAENGFDIAANDINYSPENPKKGLFEVKEVIEKLKVSFLPVQGDISVLSEHKRIIRSVLDKFGRIDVFVSNAGVAPKQRMDVLETTDESYDRVLSVNSRGPFFLTQSVSNQMIEQLRKGSDFLPVIIFITSISAVVSSTKRAEYCISKAALSMTAKLFADRLAEFGINVYEIRPGIIKTDMTAGVQDKYDRLISEGLVPQKRWGLPEDVGKAVAAFAKGDFPYSTGSVIEVSGGMDIRSL